MEIVIDEKFLELFGTGTLTGTIVKRSLETGEAYPPKEVTLVFPQTDLEFKRKNKGPKEIILLEHVPMCLVEDILRLVDGGVKIHIKESLVSE